MPYFADARNVQGGFDVDVNATRCSNYYHVERDLVHILGGWIESAGTGGQDRPRQACLG
jgi:hypothetical protein